MHVRMAHARWSTTGTEVVAQDLVDPTDSEREQFRCWYCHDVPVQFVKGGRTRNDILIRPHFRRHPTYPTHGPDCGFDFDVQFERWGQRAAEIITKSKRRIVLTLDHLVPDYSAPVPPPATADGQPNQPTTPTTPSRHLPRLQQERLQRLTCEAARDLWHLACLVEDDGAMRDRVILKLGNRAIDWSEFFFRHDVDGDLERLARMVQLQGEVPACIVGRVHQVLYDIAPKEAATASGSKTGASRKRLYDRIDLVWAKVDAHRHFAIHIGSRSPGIFSEIDTGDEVVVSGKVERQRFTNVLAGPRKVSAWCWLNNPAQVALRDDGGASQPLPA